MKIRKIAALALAVLILAHLPACGGKDSGDAVPPQGGVDSSGAYMPTVPDVSAELSAAVKENSDVVGWLQIPNTKVNEAVVQTNNNEFYMRRDVRKKYAYEGSYYIDYESVMFDGGRDLAQNTIIYGHNLGTPMGVKDDPEGVKFAQLLKLNDEETARKTPYIYLTTESGPQIFEIFAVFYCESVTSPVPYHYAEYSDEQFMELIKDAKARSAYTYSAEVVPSDRIVTLSTCSYKYGTYTQNPDQRFIVMARLARKDQIFRQEADFKVNANPKAPQF